MLKFGLLVIEDHECVCDDKAKLDVLLELHVAVLLLHRAVLLPQLIFVVKFDVLLELQVAVLLPQLIFVVKLDVLLELHVS